MCGYKGRFIQTAGEGRWYVVHNTFLVLLYYPRPGLTLTNIFPLIDDIRQDAVMQQVFSTMNVFLRDQKHQSQGDRKLRLLTYSCIPLSPAAGVLEWVENTIPLAGYLLHSKGAHTRYYPGEWSTGLCHMHMNGSPTHELRPSYDEVCKNFSPAFRFFFLEKFSHSPQLWHKARMSYTRSCAVNSMVGHILGIGDRHSNNILIHEHTGEVVHIDFGFVFEQGKVQSTPETVPFRLTRDIVDGMVRAAAFDTFKCSFSLQFI